MPVGATIGSAVIGGGATLLASSNAKKAAGDANALQKYQYDQTRADQAPWREAGVAALGQLQGFLQPGADLNNLLAQQPGYQARLQQGVDAIDRSAVAHGTLNSGGTLKALTRYGQDYGSNELGNIFNRYSALAGIGQTANNQIGQAGQNYANQAGQGLYDRAAASNYGLGGLANIGTNLLGQFGGSFGGGQTAPSIYTGANAQYSPSAVNLGSMQGQFGRVSF